MASETSVSAASDGLQREEAIAVAVETGAGENVVKFAGSVTIPPPAYELARQEAEMEVIRDMIQGFPLAVERTPQKGRYIVASRDIEAGELVMKAEPFAAAVTDHLKTKVCSSCYIFSHDKKLPLSCGKCNEVWFCSAECKNKGMIPHQLFECDFFKRMRKPKPKFDSEAYGEARLIISTLGRIIHLKRSEDEKVADGLKSLKIDSLSPPSSTPPNPSSASPNPPSTPPDPSSDPSSSSLNPSSSSLNPSSSSLNPSSSTPSNIVSAPDQNSNGTSIHREQKYEDILTLVTNEEKLHPLARDYIEGVIMIVERAMENHLRMLPPLPPPPFPSTPPSQPLPTSRSSSPSPSPSPVPRPSSPFVSSTSSASSSRSSSPLPSSTSSHADAPRSSSPLPSSSSTSAPHSSSSLPSSTSHPSSSSPSPLPSSSSSPSPSPFPQKSEYHQYILDIICKQRCNRFGIWSKTNKCLGVAISPAASFFNHCCVPNCLHEQEGQVVLIRAVHPIPKGTELCISYVSLDQSTESRKEELFTSYHFYCSCPRCKDTSGIYDEWIQNFVCGRGKQCEPLLIPAVPGKMDILKCTVCGQQKKFNPARIPEGIMTK